MNAHYTFHEIPEEVACTVCGALGRPAWTAVKHKRSERFIGLLGLQHCEACNHTHVHCTADRPADMEVLQAMGSNFLGQEADA